MSVNSVVFIGAEADRLSFCWFLIFHRSLESDNDEPYSGTALKINYHYFIRDKDDTLYWTDFEWTELEQSNEFIKSVRIGKSTNPPVDWVILIVYFYN